MRILALEFSSPQRSVAVVQTSAAGAVLRSHEVVETGAGGAQPFKMIAEALGDAGLEREQIECVALGLGPGSYTGIRIAIALAQGWHLANQVRLLGISSADAIAADTAATGLIGSFSVLIDAQRNEFYLARYAAETGGWRALAPLRLATLAEAQGLLATGELVVSPQKCKDFSPGRVLVPRAATLGALAARRTDSVPAERLEPIYLRETSFVKAAPPRKIFD